MGNIRSQKVTRKDRDSKWRVQHCTGSSSLSYFSCMLFCMYVIHVHMFLCMHVCRCGSQRLALGGLPLLLSTLFCEDSVSLTEHGAPWFYKSSFMASAGDPPVSSSTEVGLQAFITMPDFLCGCWESKLGSLWLPIRQLFTERARFLLLSYVLKVYSFLINASGS